MSGRSGAAVQKYSKRREALLTAALRVFTQRGLEATGIKEIAAALGITHPALYHYFQSKDQMVFAAIEKAMLDLIAVLQLALQNARPQATHQLISLMYAHAVYESREFPITPFANAVVQGPLKSAAALGPKQRVRISGLQQEVLSFYRRVIAKGQKEREFSDGPVSVMSSGILSLISYNVFFPCQGDMLEREAFIEAVIEQALRSIGVCRVSSEVAMAELEPSRHASKSATIELEGI